MLEPVHFGVFKEIGDAINDVNQVYGKENITFASNFNNVDYINYYVEDDLSETIIDWDQPAAMDALVSRAKNAKTPYFAYSFSNSFNVPMFYEAIRLHYPTVIKTVQTKYSIFVLFGKSDKERSFGPAIRKAKSSKLKQTNAEFAFEDRFNIKDLPSQESKWNYYILRCKVNSNDSIPLYLTLTADRNGEAWKKGEDLAVYYSYEFSKFVSSGKEKYMICAFTLPDDIRSTDQLKYYIWNPTKGEYAASDIEIYFGEIE